MKIKRSSLLVALVLGSVVFLFLAFSLSDVYLSPNPVGGSAFFSKSKAGDVNCDGKITKEDMTAYVSSLVSNGELCRQVTPTDERVLSELLPDVPRGTNLKGDINCDGLVNFADINPFVNCVVQGGCGSCEICGNGVKGQGEDCDIDDLGGESCYSLGYDSGNLYCNESCIFDTSECYSSGVNECGNGHIEIGEVCDNNVRVCLDEVSQTQYCNEECSGWLPCSLCGNGFIEGLENCDDGNDDGLDGCDHRCRLEECGNGIVQKGEQCDDGNIVNEDGCSANCLSEAPNPFGEWVAAVFVTTTLRNGGFGDVEEADLICQETASKAGVGGWWKAWISDDEEDARDRLAWPLGVPIYLLHNPDTMIADSLYDLTDGILAHAISSDEYGGSDTNPAWTGTLIDGRYSGVNCADWMNSDSITLGLNGHSWAAKSQWTEGGNIECNAVGSFYCFEQPNQY